MPERSPFIANPFLRLGASVVSLGLLGVSGLWLSDWWWAVAVFSVLPLVGLASALAELAEHAALGEDEDGSAWLVAGWPAPRELPARRDIKALPDEVEDWLREQDN
jgi:hypothetical protein